MMVNIIKKNSALFFIVFILVLFSSNIYANNGRVPDKIYNLRFKYDPNTGDFYEFQSVDSLWYLLQQRSKNEISFKHTLDNLLGTPITKVNNGEFFSLQPRKRVFNLINANGDTLTGESGLSYAEALFANNTSSSFGRGAAGACNPAIGVPANSNRIEFGVPNPYQNGDRCISSREVLGHARAISNIPNRNYIERLFKFDLTKITNSPFGVYKGSLYARNDAWWNFGVSASVGFRYDIVLEIAPYITELKFDNEILSFDITKTGSYIEGFTSTGFSFLGGFNKGQKLGIAIDSQNKAFCEGKLCLRNLDNGQVLPYSIELVDGGTLLAHKYTLSNQKFNIFSAQRSIASGKLDFSFLAEDTAKVGRFSDIVTVRVELSL